MKFSDYCLIVYPLILDRYLESNKVNGVLSEGLSKNRLDVITESFWDDPGDGETFNPATELPSSMKTAIATKDKPIPAESCSILLRNYGAARFTDYIDGLSEEAAEKLRARFKTFGFILSQEKNAMYEELADLYHMFITNFSLGIKSVAPEEFHHRTPDGLLLSEVPLEYAYVQGNRLFIGEKILKLPYEATVPAKIGEEEIPYFNAIIEAICDKEGLDKDELDINNLAPLYKIVTKAERQHFYAADAVSRGVRDVFNDADDELENMEKDLFNGILYTLISTDNKNGFERMMNVLDKSTSVPLPATHLERITGLITNAVKQGTCHVLVNKRIIKSWVKIDDLLI